MDSFYRSNKDYQRVVNQLRESRKISSPNRKTLLAFAERLVALRLSPARIKKQLVILRTIAQAVNRDFRYYRDSDVQKVLAMIAARGYAIWTLNDYKTALKSMLRFAQGEPLDPKMISILRVNRRGPNKFQLTYSDLLTPEEVSRLVGAAHHPMYKCLISLAYETAARPSELLTLTVGNVLFAEGYSKLALRESKTFLRTVYALDSDRYLRAWLNLHPTRTDRASPLFPSSYISYEKKEFLKPESYNVTLKRLARKVRIAKRVYSYLLRHTRITHLLEAGWNEVMIKKLAGHSLESRAFKVYEHLAEKQLEDYAVGQHNRERAALRLTGLDRDRVCTFCSTTNNPDTNFCAHCNRAISLDALMESQEKERELLRMLTPEMIDALVAKKVEEALRARSAPSWQEVG